MTEIERKKKLIINILYFGVIIALFYFFMKFCFGLLFPFVLALFVAMILQRPINYITAKSHFIKRGPLSAFFVITIFAVFILFIALAGAKIASEFKGFFDLIMLKLENVPAFVSQIEDWFNNNLTFLPEGIRSSLSSTISTFLENSVSSSDVKVEQSGSFDFSVLLSPIMGVLSSASQIPSIIIAFLVALITCCFMTSDFPLIKEFIFRQFPPEKSDKISKAKAIIFTSISKMGKAYAIIISVTFMEILLGLSLLKLLNIYNGNYVFVIAILTAIIDIIPVLGTGSILVPWALFSFINGDVGLGIGILILYGVVTVVRQVMEPKLVAGQLGLPPFLTIMGMYIGSQIFGVLGIFIVPLLIIFIKALNDEGIIHLYKPSEKKEPTQ